MASEAPFTPRAGQVVTPERLRVFLNTEHSVRKWIEDTLKVPIRGDFMESLKNGIILCYLMRALDDQAIPRIQESTPLAASQAQENISFVLASIADYGVSRHKMFFTMDLWNGNSRPRVVECLAELARVAAAKKFPIQLSASDLPIDKLPEKLSEDQTKILVDQLGKTRNTDTGAQRREAPGLFKRKLTLLVGQQDYPAFEKRWIRIQALIRARAARSRFQSRVMMQAFRDKVAHELMDTENTYVGGLKTCIERYLQPLRDGTWNKKLQLDKQQIKTMFSDIEIIYGLNTKLKSDIDTSVQNWSPSQRLGDIFLSIMGFLKVYANYVSTCDAQLQAYDALLKSNKLFQQFVEETRSNSNVLDIPGYLIMPIQRVPRYFMLLERLLKNTWKEHRDYENLEKAVKGLQEVALYLNEKKRTFENLRAMFSVQELIQGCPHIASITRHLVSQHELNDLKKKEEYFAVILSDSIILAKTERKKGVVHKFKNMIQNNEASVVQDGDKAYDIMAKGSSVLKILANSAANEFFASFNKNKNESSKNAASLTSESPGIAITEIPEEPISPEELLKQRELEKRQLKAKMEEEMKASNQSGSSNSDSKLSSSQSPSRGVPKGPIDHLKATPSLRSTASLLKMKAIVEQQINVIDTQLLNADKAQAEDYRKLAQNLGNELAELEGKLDEVKSTVSAEEREALAKEESAIRLQVSEEPKTMRTKKKARKSFFSFFSSSSGNNSSDDEGNSSPSKKDKSSTPPSSGKVKLSKSQNLTVSSSVSPSRRGRDSVGGVAVSGPEPSGSPTNSNSQNK